MIFQIPVVKHKTSDKILISSKGFKESICTKGDFDDKLVYFPNWADGNLEGNLDYDLPLMPNGFKIMFAGNVGEENTPKFKAWKCGVTLILEHFDTVAEKIYFKLAINSIERGTCTVADGVPTYTKTEQEFINHEIYSDY